MSHVECDFTLCVFMAVSTSDHVLFLGLTRYRAHTHKRSASIESCPRARLSDFFRAAQIEL